MKRSYLNFIINAFMTLCVSVIISTGFLMKYTLISGQERWEKYGSNVELTLFEMDRHDWGLIHLIFGFVFFGLLVFHIYLHWKTITCVFEKMIKVPLTKKIIAIIFIVICVLLIIIPFFVRPKIDSITKGDGRHVAIYEVIETQHSQNISIVSNSFCFIG